MGIAFIDGMKPFNLIEFFLYAAPSESGIEKKTERLAVQSRRVTTIEFAKSCRHVAQRPTVMSRGVGLEGIDNSLTLADIKRTLQPKDRVRMGSQGSQHWNQDEAISKRLLEAFNTVVLANRRDDLDLAE